MAKKKSKKKSGKKQTNKPKDIKKQTSKKEADIELGSKKAKKKEASRENENKLVDMQEEKTGGENKLENTKEEKTGGENKLGNTQEEKTGGENKLELHSMTKKERRAAKKEIYREYTKDMSPKEKFSYFITYYKWYIIVPICCALLISYIAVTVYKNTRPLALSYAILNVDNADALDYSFQDEYAELFNLDKDYNFSVITKYRIDYDYFLSNSEYITTSNSTDYNLLSTQCELGDFDVLITNTTGAKYCSAEKLVRPLKGYFDVNQYAELENYMVDFEDSGGTLRPYAIDISNTEFARKLNPGYQDVYLIFPGASERNKKNSLQLLEYIYGIQLIE